MTTYSDDFNRADAGSADPAWTGGGAGDPTNPAWKVGVYSNRLHARGGVASANGWCYFNTAPPMANAHVQVTMGYSTGGSTSLVLALRINPADGSFLLLRANDIGYADSSGGFTVLSTLGAGIVQGDVVEAHMAGSTISIYRNSTLLVSISSSLNATTGTRHGVSINAWTNFGFTPFSTNPWWDDFSISTVSVVPPLRQAGRDDGLRRGPGRNAATSRQYSLRRGPRNTYT